MIIDSSAIIAILQKEPGADALLAAVTRADCRMSAATLVEAGIVADGRSAAHGEYLDRFLEGLGVEVVDLTAHQARIARQAYRRYGRGSGSPARLNFGDCFAYALAVTTGEPLLFVGSDFAHTDVLPALSPTI